MIETSNGIFQQIKDEIRFERKFESELRKKRETLLGVINMTDQVIDLMDVNFQSSFDDWSKEAQRHHELRARRLMNLRIDDVWTVIPERVKRVSVGDHKYYKYSSDEGEEMLTTWDAKTINDYCRKSVESLPGGCGFIYWIKKAVRRDI